MSSRTLPTTSRSLVVQHHIQDAITLDGPDATFALKTNKLPLIHELPGDSVLVQTLYLSNDPAQRLWIQKGSTHEREDMVALPLGLPMKAFTVSKVLAVGTERQEGDEPLKEGDLVLATGEWSDYTVLKKAAVTKVTELPGLSPSVWLGALGNSGWTAYWGLVETLKPGRNDTLVVSGAAGAVGNVVVQYAKNVLGVKRVVAIAGTQAKCDWLRSIGADAAINYKSSSFEKELAEATPDQVDLFFDNVGGSILDALLLRMKPHGKIAACGAMALYNDTQSATLKNYINIILNRIHIIGFTIMDYMGSVDEAAAALTSAVQEGKLKVDGAETVVDIKGKIEDIPKIWMGLFDGVNTGKLVTKV